MAEYLAPRFNYEILNTLNCYISFHILILSRTYKHDLVSNCILIRKLCFFIATIRSQQFREEQLFKLYFYSRLLYNSACSYKSLKCETTYFQLIYTHLYRTLHLFSLQCTDLHPQFNTSQIHSQFEIQTYVYVMTHLN